MHVLKGHGTENDFVLIPDFDGALELSPALVRRLCDRHAGIGADGVLRIVRSAAAPEARAMADQAPYFMDYRNADGSIAEMCGNGVRVFVQYLERVGLVGDVAAVATRGGIMRVLSSGDGNVTVDMGQPLVLADRPVVTAAYDFARASLAAVSMPNPHVIVEVASLAELAVLELGRPPLVEPPLPEGQNLEFILREGPRRIRLRVHERGVGETRSCGTGICAVVAAVASRDGTGADGQAWEVLVPGGRCEVIWRPDGEITLSGPAVIVAEIELDERWLAASPG